MYHHILCLSFISIFICLTSANDDQPNLDDYNQMINNYDQLSSLNNSTQNQNMIDLLQSIPQLNSTQQTNFSKNVTGFKTNLTTSGIPTLYNTYQYDSQINPETRTKDQTQSILLDSSGTNQNYFAKEYAGFDDNQKMFIEQQIEQDSKYLPDIFDTPPPMPTQIIEQQPSAIDNSLNQEYGTKLNKINKSIQSSFKAPVVANNNRLNKSYQTKGTVNSIKMANNQEWNVVNKNQQQSLINIDHSGFTGIEPSSNYLQQSSPSEDTSFTSLDQQYDLTKVNKVINQPKLNKPIEDSVQIITANNQPVQQQIITNYPTKQQTIGQSYSSSPVVQQAITRKPPCNKVVNLNYEANRQRPFYFGWKQHQPQKTTINQRPNFVQQQNYPHQANNNNYQTKYFGMPNSFDQQIAPQFSKVRKCCIIKLVPKPVNFNKAQSQFPSASASTQSNPFQNNLTGMFGIGVNSVVNKIENKKRKVKNLIKAPFIFVNGMKNKALSSSNQYRPNYNPNFNPNYNPNFKPTFNPNYIQQQNTFTSSKSYNQDFGY